MAHRRRMRGTALESRPYTISVPFAGSSFTEIFGRSPSEPLYQRRAHQLGDLAGHARVPPAEKHVSILVYPLVFGSRNVGFFILSFRRNAPEIQRSELLVALAQQATLAVQLTRLAYRRRRRRCWSSAPASGRRSTTVWRRPSPGF